MGGMKDAQWMEAHQAEQRERERKRKAKRERAKARAAATKSAYGISDSRFYEVEKRDEE